MTLGKNNREDAGTVVRAAFSECADVLRRAEEMAGVYSLTSRYDRTFRFAWASSEQGLIAKWRETATDAGFAALLAARAGEPQQTRD